jgi:cyclase
MNRTLLLSSIAAIGVLTACAFAQSPPEMRVEKVADRLFVITDSNDDGNTAVLIREEGLVIVDTKSMRGGQQLLEAVRGISNKPVTHILHTHHHYDHVGGNARFPAAVTVVAHENAAARMPAMEEFRGPDRQHGLPDQTFKDTLTLFSGNDAIDLYHFGPAHTDNDAFIVFRSQGVMHSGDTFPGVAAQERDGGSRQAYPTSLGRAAQISGVRTVIPGHGTLKTWQQFLDNAAALNKPQ